MTEDEYTRAIKAHGNRLYLIALSYTKSHHDAEDIVQDVFLKLWKNKASFESEEHLAKWLTLACVNRCKDSLRTSFLRRNTSLDDARELYTFDSQRDFEIFSAVMSLPKKDSMVIHLFYYEDMSAKEIAEVMHSNESAVKTRLHRARNKLKQILGDDRTNE